MPAIDIFDIKAQNVKRIIDVVRFKKSMTKRDIADATSLSFATVSNLCNELLEKGILTSTKKEAPSVGRTPNDFALFADRFNIICINLQMEGVMGFAVLNLNNEVVFQDKYDISAQKTAEDIISFAKSVFDSELAHIKNPDTVFIGVGVAVSSIFDAGSETLINCAIDLFTGVPLKKIVEEVFGLPAYVDNEANLCARSVSAPDGKGAHIVYLYVSQGVGLGVICHGRLLRGTRGFAAEIAHLPIGDMRIKCPDCGNYGCIENELSVGGFLSQAFGEQRDHKKQNWGSFIELLKAGNDKALALAKKNGALLGKLSSMLVNLFDPSILYIGGDIVQIFAYIAEPFFAELQGRCTLTDENYFEVICDTKSDHTINVGISEEICKKWAETILQEQYD